MSENSSSGDIPTVIDLTILSTTDSAAGRSGGGGTTGSGCDVGGGGGGEEDAWGCCKFRLRFVSRNDRNDMASHLHDGTGYHSTHL